MISNNVNDMLRTQDAINIGEKKYQENKYITYINIQGAYIRPTLCSSASYIANTSPSISVGTSDFLSCSE